MKQPKLENEWYASIAWWAYHGKKGSINDFNKIPVDEQVKWDRVGKELFDEFMY